MILVPQFRGFVRTFVFICAAVFVLLQFAHFGPMGSDMVDRQLVQFFGLVPELLFRGMVYQLVTWVFFHGNLSHLLFNMLGFWMFGSLIEETWGTRKFIKFTALAGIISGMIVGLFGLIDPLTYATPTIGASGIVFAILMAVARLFPNQMVLVFFVFPMKMRYFAWIMVAIEFYALYSSNSQGISNIAHLGGGLVGYLLASWFGPGRFDRKTGTSGIGDWFRRLRDRWHQRRMRKRLRVIRMDGKTRYH